MLWIHYVVTYIAMASFGFVVLARFVRFKKMPLHLRWELYPVPHEGGSKAKYGGSYFEEVGWWAKPNRKSHLGVLKTMLPEMLFLVTVFKHNRALWWCSFPFHFGLYLLIGTIKLLVIVCVLGLVGINFSDFLIPLARGTFCAGWLLGSVGTIGLLTRRILNPRLRPFTNHANIFHLSLFLVFFVMTGLSFIAAEQSLEMIRLFLKNLITFRIDEPVGGSLLAVEIIFTVCLIAYIPMTGMAHFFLKWFTYHDVRWDDEPMGAGCSIEKKMIAQLKYPMPWSSYSDKSHPQTWEDVAVKGVRHEHDE